MTELTAEQWEVWDRLKNGIPKKEKEKPDWAADLVMAFKKLEKEAQKYEQEIEQFHQGIDFARQKDFVAEGAKGSGRSGRVSKSNFTVRQCKRNYSQVRRQEPYTRRGR